MTSYTLEGPTWATRTLTWSFANLSQPNSTLFSAAIGAAYQAVVRNAVARWDDVVNLSFQEVADSTAGVDIRIGWSQFGTAGKIGETDYTYSYSSATPQHFQPGVLVRLEDPAQIPLSAAPAAVYQGYLTNLYQVVLHELGHALGLNHATDATAVMYSTSTDLNRDLNETDLDGIHALYAAPAFAMTNTVTQASSHPDGETYSGPVSYLQQQYIFTGSDSVAIASTSQNVFIHGGSGDDAIAVTAGQNVLDGGEGSNFLVGGTGTDVFFLDGRGGKTTWGTLVNFHQGDTATLWGYDASISTKFWDGTAGAAGYSGPTLRAALAGGAVTTSVTFANMSAADQARLVMNTGTIDGNAYLTLTLA